MENNESINICPECKGEYYSSIKICAKCNIELIPKVEETAITPFSINRALIKKILISFLGIALFQLGFYIPIPGLDLDVLSEFLQSNLLENFLSSFNIKTSIFALDINPYIAGAGIVIFLSGVIPYLRKLREGDFKQVALFNKVISVATLIAAAIMALPVTIFLQSIVSYSGEPLVLFSKGVFRTIAIIVLILGALVIGWIAEMITAKGILNGVAFIILYGILKDYISILYKEFSAIINNREKLLLDVILLLIIVAMIFLSLWFLTVKKKLPLSIASPDNKNVEEKQTSITLPIRLNLVGILPVLFTSGILMLPVMFGYMQYYSVSYLSIYIILTFLLTFFYTAIHISPKNIIDTLKKFGYAIKDVPTGTDSSEYLDKLVFKTALPTALILCIISLAPFIAVNWPNINSLLINVLGSNLLVVCAIGIEVMRKVNTEKIKQRISGNYNKKITWIPVCFVETELEGDLIRDILYRDNVPSIKKFSRGICITGTLGIWEICRPSHPYLTIYRGIGKGETEIQVPSEYEEKAIEILNNYNSES